MEGHTSSTPHRESPESSPGPDITPAPPPLGAPALPATGAGTGTPAGPPPPQTTTTPSEYTPTFLVQAYDVTLNFISAELGDHMYQVFQEMRADAEAYAKQHKEKPKRILSQLVDEVKDWRHIPVAKGDSATILDQEVDAGVTVRVPAIRDFVNEVYVRVAKGYSGRNGTSRLYRHLTMNKDKLISEVRHAASAALFPRESVWGAPEDLGKSISVAPPPDAAPPDPALSRKTIPIGPPGQAEQASVPAEEQKGGFKNEELPEGGSDSGSGSASEDDGF
ncbi:hypothetical protein WJX74_003778 [Apatococcus lobatus]|uniref:Uncharacterized protein n=1 Tax=Apatococcus lobatus TaxID=904363 RepID=A0AAW1R0D2_9CHLO